MGVGAEAPSLLSGLIFDSDGNRMTPTHANKRGRRYRYYISSSLLDRGTAGPNTMRVPAGEIDGLVLDRLHALISSRQEIANAIDPLALSAKQLDLVLKRAAELDRQWFTMPPDDMRSLARQIIGWVSLSPDRIEIVIGSGWRAKISVPHAITTSWTFMQCEFPLRLPTKGRPRRELFRCLRE